MDLALTILFALLGALTASFIVFWVSRLRRGPPPGAKIEPGTETGQPSAVQLAIGFVTDFLDTLGIGSYATTTALFRFLRQVPDRLIPGTLNVGHALPTVLQAFVYILAIKVDMTTLISMIAAAVLGAWLGAGFVAGLPRRQVQGGMGVALLLAGSIILYRLLDPAVGSQAGTTALSGAGLAIAVGVNFVLGALMTIGVGLYAPCMVLVAMLGMEGSAAFPIMMGSCAFLMPAASFPFIRKASYSPRAAIGLALGGLPGVAIAAWIVKSLPLKSVNWLVVGVVFYTSLTLLRSATRATSRLEV